MTGVLGQASGVASGMPQGDSLLAPLSGALGRASALATANPHDVLALFEQAASAGDGSLGMSALAGPLTSLQSIRSNALVAMVLQLLASAVPGGLALDRTITQFGDQAVGIAAVVRLVGALMSTEALTREVSTTAQTIAGMLDSTGADGALSQLATAANASLVDLINAANPDDPDQVAFDRPAGGRVRRLDPRRNRTPRRRDGVRRGDARRSRPPDRCRSV